MTQDGAQAQSDTPRQPVKRPPVTREELIDRSAADPAYALAIAEVFVDYLHSEQDIIFCTELQRGRRGIDFLPTAADPVQLAHKFVDFLAYQSDRSAHGGAASEG